jgi:hypothetical protein
VFEDNWPTFNIIQDPLEEEEEDTDQTSSMYLAV